MNANKYLGIYHPDKLKWTGEPSTNDIIKVFEWMECPAQTPEAQMECKHYEPTTNWYCKFNDDGCSDECHWRLK